MKLTPNELSFIALANEYCQAAEQASRTEPAEFVDTMLRLLPRIYITASDLDAPDPDPEAYINDVLEEDYYDSVRRNIEAVLGEDDAYLEVFQEDMKYSDTPIAASVAEGLADLFQVFYNFIETVRDATDDVVAGALALVKEDFGAYWSKPLCNLLRALNDIKY